MTERGHYLVHLVMSGLCSTSKSVGSIKLIIHKTGLDSSFYLFVCANVLWIPANQPFNLMDLLFMFVIPLLSYTYITAKVVLLFVVHPHLIGGKAQ